MTAAETVLWGRLRRSSIGVKFRRQHPFGPYVFDFYAEKAHLAVEIDGSRHFSEEGVVLDAEPTRYLEGAGVHVLRFNNREVPLEADSVLETTCEAIKGYDLSR